MLDDVTGLPVAPWNPNSSSGDKNQESNQEDRNGAWQKLPPLKEAMETSDGSTEDRSDRVDYYGTIRLVADNSNYAFISCNESRDKCGRDIFLHEKHVGRGGLIVGNKVKFRVTVNTRRQPFADPVELLGWDDES